MVKPMLTQFEDLGTKQKELVNEVCERFEAQLRSGSCARVETYLEHVDESLQALLMRELLLLEFEYRFRSMDPPSDEELALRFPDKTALLDETMAEARANSLCHEPPGAGTHQFSDYSRWLDASGRFRIYRELGRGGFGVVYHAELVPEGTEVAVKAPLSGPNAPQAFRRRFLREGRVLSLLNHPNIARILDVGETGPLCYIVSEYVSGPPLDRWLDEEGGSLSPTTAARLVQILARTIEFAHQSGVLHCDLKPANVLMTRGSGLNPKLVDFGLARLMNDSDSLSQSGQILGSPLYMAPEQAAGSRRDVTCRTDVHGLGAILYEILTGGPPVAPGPLVQVLAQVQQQDPKDVRWQRPDVPPELEAICLKCLEKLPSRRYESAQLLAEDLESFLTGQRTIARPRGLFARGMRWSRRHPNMMGFVLVATLSLAVVTLAWRQTKAALEEVELERSSAIAKTIQLESALTARDQARGQSEENARLASFLVGDLLVRRERLFALRDTVGRFESFEEEEGLRKDLERWLPLGRRQLADYSGDRELADIFIRALKLFASLEWIAGRGNSAISCQQEVVELSGRMKEHSPAGELTFKVHLAEATCALATYFFERERFLDAISAAQAAKVSYADLVGQDVDSPWRLCLPECQLLEALALNRLKRSVQGAAILRAIIADLGPVLQSKRHRIYARQLQVRVLRSLDDFKQAIILGRKLAQLDPDDWLSSWYLAQAHFTLATKEGKPESFRDAVPVLQSTLDKLKRKQGATPNNPELAVAATEIMSVLSRCHAALGDYASAEQVGMIAYHEIHKMVVERPTRILLTGYQLALFTELPNAIYQSGQHKKALDLARQTADLFADIIVKLPVGFSRVDAYFNVLMTISIVLRQCGDLEGASAVAMRSQKLIDRFQKEDPKNHLFAEISAEAWTNIAKNRIRKLDHESTISAMRQAIAWQEQALKLHPDQAPVPIRLDDRWGRLGRFLASIERWEEAEEVMRTREKLWPKNSEGLTPLKVELQKLCAQIRESKPAPNSKKDQLAKRWNQKIAELESVAKVVK